MDDISKLTDYELNCAVARMLGWQQDAKHPLYWLDGEGESHRISKEPNGPRHYFNPANDSNTALDLPDDGWDWQFTDCWDHPTGKRGLEVVCDYPAKFASYIKVFVIIADYPTKSAAYARARCEAWLMGKIIEE